MKERERIKQAEDQPRRRALVCILCKERSDESPKMVVTPTRLNADVAAVANPMEATKPRTC